MNAWRDRVGRMMGKTRFVVCRVFIHLAGQEVAPLLGVLNQAARDAIESEGDLEVLGEGLVDICQSLLQYDTYWQSAANEGDVFWNEGEAGDYYTDLYTDSAQRYKSDAMTDGVTASAQDTLYLPITQNLVVMIVAACEGEVPELETDLADITALKAGLKALINVHYQGRLRDLQIHVSPARLGDELTTDQLLQYFPELIPL